MNEKMFKRLDIEIESGADGMHIQYNKIRLAEKNQNITIRSFIWRYAVTSDTITIIFEVLPLKFSTLTNVTFDSRYTLWPTFSVACAICLFLSRRYVAFQIRMNRSRVAQEKSIELIEIEAGWNKIISRNLCETGTL